MKKFLFVLVLILSVFVFVGCAEVTYSVTISDLGARVYEYRITLDNSTNYSGDIELIKTFLEYQKTKNDYAEVVFDEENPNVIIYRISFESQTEYYLANGITGDEPNEPSEFTEKGLFRYYEGIVFDMDKTDFASYALTYLYFSYKDSFDTSLRNGLKNYINDSNLSKTANECVIRVCTDTKNTTAQSLILELDTSEVASELADITYKVLKDMGYDYAKISAYFEYSHAFSSISGVNPDKVETVRTDLGKAKVYTWNIDPLGNNQIVVSQRTPNVWLWELIALLFGILVAGVVVAVFLVKRKKMLASVANEKLYGNGNKESKNEPIKAEKNIHRENIANRPNSPYASWFGYSPEQIKNANNQNPKNDNQANGEDEDVFDGYFDKQSAEENNNSEDKDE